MKKSLLFLSVLMICLAYACQKNAITGRRELSLVPESEMMTMSFAQYDTFLLQNKPLPANDKNVILVRQVGQRIQKAVEKFYADKGLSSQLQGYQWEFNVVNSPQVNAWCMPGGKVVVYTGILPVTQDENSLAVVMGHEISHAVAKHGNERMSQGMLVQLGGQALSVALQSKPQLTQQLFLQSFGVGSQLGMLKFSRTDETEADHMGLVFMAMAGYNPETALPFWERMAAQSANSQQPMEFLNDHPSDATRIADIKTFMPEAKKYYVPR